MTDLWEGEASTEPQRFQHSPPGDGQPLAGHLFIVDMANSLYGACRFVVEQIVMKYLRQMFRKHDERATRK